MVLMSVQERPKDGKVIRSPQPIVSLLVAWRCGNVKGPELERLRNGEKTGLEERSEERSQRRHKKDDSVGAHGSL
jgi:hypothetical protein